MEESHFMFSGSVAKIVLAFVGVVITLVLMIYGLVKKDKAKLKKAAFVFVATAVVLVAFSLVEFFILAEKG